MKKKILAGLLTGTAVFAMAGMASAATVTTTYTGDNIIGAWYLDGGGSEAKWQIPGTNFDNWQKADTANLTLLDGHNYHLVWAVINSGGMATNNPSGTGTNPAAFLGQITGDIVGGPSYSGATNWKISTNNATWTNATSYGANGDTNSIWHSVNHGSVSGIDQEAQWIWTSGNDVSAWIKADFKTTATPPEAVPLPGAALLFGSGVTGLIGLRRRKKD